MKKHLYIIQKMVTANSLEEALKKEKKAIVVEVSLVGEGKDKLEPAIGFMFQTNNFKEDEDA